MESNFRDIYDKSKSNREAKLAQASADADADERQRRQNMVDAEEWLTEAVLATLARANEELADKLSVTFHDNFTGMKTKESDRRQVIFTISPQYRTRYHPLPHYLTVGPDRKFVCIAYSEYDPKGPRETFSGNIDDATREDIEGEIAKLVKWWAEQES